MATATSSAPEYVEDTEPASAARVRVPAWLIAATVVWMGLAVAPHGPAPLTLRDDSGYIFLLWVALRGLESGAFLWAATRVALGARLRQALRLFAGTWALGCLATASFVPELFGGQGLLPVPVYRAIIDITYVTGLAAVLWMPTTAIPRTQWREYLLDLAVSALGMLVVGMVVAWPQLVASGAGQRFEAIAGLAPQVLMTAALNRFVLRGVARPSRRAFWLVAAGTAGNLATSTAYSLPNGAQFGISFSVLTSLATLWAAHAFHDDPLSHDGTTPVPAWLRAFNPLPPLVAVGGGALLIREALQAHPAHVPLLAATLMMMVVLLVLRNVVTSAENLRLVAEQAARDRAAERARVDALTTLTGGIAHWYNNLLTVVLGNAELGEYAARGQDARMVTKSLGSIRSAAERAADLTRQLMAYSGRQVHRRERLDLDAFVPQAVARLRATLPPSLHVAVEPAGGPLWVAGDREQLGMVIEELLVNASQAMQGTGTVVIRLGAGGQTPPRVTLDVTDDGPGAPPNVLALMFDPFFTTRGITEAAGLGLAAVRGVVAVHGGHVHARSDPGGGLVVSIALPAADAAS